MAPHSSTLAWKIPWTEEPGRLQSMGLWRVGHNCTTSLWRIGEGNGNPLQCSCLENPRDGKPGGPVYGVAQSQTRLKRCSSSSSSIKLHWYEKICHPTCLLYVQHVTQCFKHLWHLKYKWMCDWMSNQSAASSVSVVDVEATFSFSLYF